MSESIRPPADFAPPIRIGTAGWTLPAAVQPDFPPDGTHLERYAGRLAAVEINSSFYRPHRPATYARWAASVPPSFRFSVKLPKSITHELRLRGANDALASFLGQVSELGDKLGCLLMQLPPSLAFDVHVVDGFFGALRDAISVAAVCEPRHATWFTPEAEALMERWRIGRVAADPAIVPDAAEPGGWRGIAYHRLHGSPRIYYSTYPDAYLDALASRLRANVAAGRDTWCIFDNTAEGAAARNALDLQVLLMDGHA